MEFSYGIGVALTLIDRLCIFLFVKLISDYLGSFSLIRHFIVNVRILICILLSDSSNFSVTFSLVSPTARIAVSPAKVTVVSFSNTGMLDL